MCPEIDASEISNARLLLDSIQRYVCKIRIAGSIPSAAEDQQSLPGALGQSRHISVVHHHCGKINQLVSEPVPDQAKGASLIVRSQQRGMSERIRKQFVPLS